MTSGRCRLVLVCYITTTPTKENTMYTQTKSYLRNRTANSQRATRNRAASFLPELGNDRVIGLGYGRSSGYGVIDSVVPGSRLQFRYR